MLISRINGIAVITFPEDIPAPRDAITGAACLYQTVKDTAGMSLESLHAYRCDRLSAGNTDPILWVRADGTIVTLTIDADTGETFRHFAKPLTKAESDDARKAIDLKYAQGRPAVSAKDDTSWVKVDSELMPDGTRIDDRPNKAKDAVYQRRAYLRRKAGYVGRTGRDASKSAETAIDTNVIGVQGSRDTGRFVPGHK